MFRTFFFIQEKPRLKRRLSSRKSSLRNSIRRHNSKQRKSREDSILASDSDVLEGNGLLSSPQPNSGNLTLNETFKRKHCIWFYSQRFNLWAPYLLKSPCLKIICCMLYYLRAQCVYLQVYTNLWKNIVAVGTDHAFCQINVSIKLLWC